MARFSWPWSRREQFSSWSVGDRAFAAWLRGETDEGEAVTPYTVIGLSAVLRSVSVISTTIAGLPLHTYERQGDERVHVASVFDDPYPGIDGMTPFAWVETVLIHLLLWRNAYLWHEARDTRSGDVIAYRPIVPDAISKVEIVNGRKQFTYTDAANEKKVVGSEWITHIPGPSIDGAAGHPLLAPARAIFSGAISGDKSAQVTLRRGIRLAGLLVPEQGEEVDETEAGAILESLRSKVVGRENAGDVAVINRRMKLQPWTPNNIEMQWAETRQMVLGEIERLFGMPPHLLADTEKQTSWGTGVAEQNLGLARYTLRGWSDRIEQTLTRRLPTGQFCEFDYKGLLQGTPAQEIELLIAQVEAGLLTLDEARRILNRPPLTAAQKAAIQPPPPPAEPAGFAAELFARQEPPVVNVTVPQNPPASVTFERGAVEVSSPNVTVEPAVVNVTTPDQPVTVTLERGAVELSAPVTVEPAVVNVTTPDVHVVNADTAQIDPTALAEAVSGRIRAKPVKKRVERDEAGLITAIIDEEPS